MDQVDTFGRDLHQDLLIALHHAEAGHEGTVDQRVHTCLASLFAKQAVLTAAAALHDTVTASALDLQSQTLQACFRFLHEVCVTNQQETALLSQINETYRQTIYALLHNWENETHLQRLSDLLSLRRDTKLSLYQAPRIRAELVKDLAANTATSPVLARTQEAVRWIGWTGDFGARLEEVTTERRPLTEITDEPRVLEAVRELIHDAIFLHAGAEQTTNARDQISVLMSLLKLGKDIPGHDEPIPWLVDHPSARWAEGIFLIPDLHPVHPPIGLTDKIRAERLQLGLTLLGIAPDDPAALQAARDASDTPFLAYTATPGVDGLIGVELQPHPYQEMLVERLAHGEWRNAWLMLEAAVVNNLCRAKLVDKEMRGRTCKHPTHLYPTMMRLCIEAMGRAHDRGRLDVAAAYALMLQRDHATAHRHQNLRDSPIEQTATDISNVVYQTMEQIRKPGTKLQDRQELYQTIREELLARTERRFKAAVQARKSPHLIAI